MSFAGKIITAFNNLFSFLGRLFASLFQLIANGFNELIKLLAKPLSLLYYFLDGIFYFIFKVFDVVVLVIKLFVALFQFLGAIFLGVFRTIHMWLIPSLSSGMHYPSSSSQGFSTFFSLAGDVGLTTIVPIIAICFCWFFFVLKIISLFGGEIMVRGFGNSGKGG